MRIESLTFFRFIAAIIVVCFHFGKETNIPLWLGEISISGAEMVTFFFVLSGFVMLVSHYHKPAQQAVDYYVKRLARIMPVYLLALAPFVLVYSDTMGFLLSMTFTQAWFSPYPLKPNVPAWSLSVEMFFYLLFPGIIYLIKQYNIRALTLLIVSLLVYCVTQSVVSRLIQPDIYQGESSLTHDLIFFFPLSHLCSFLLGITAGKFFIEKKQYFNSNNKLQLLFFLISLMAVYFALNNKQNIIDLFSFPVVLGSSFFSPLFLLLVLGIASSNNILTRVLSKPMFVFLGEISYSLYIIQLPVQALCVITFPEYIANNKTLFFIMYLFSLIFISSFVYRFFEIPCKKYILKRYYIISNKIQDNSHLKPITS